MAPSTPEPPYRQALREVAAGLAGVRDQLNDLHGRLSIQLDGVSMHAPVEGFAQVAVPGHEGMYWSLLPPLGLPLGSYSHMVVQGGAGVHFPRTSIPHLLRVCVLAGALLWNQASTGEARRRIGPGEYIDVAPGEEYGYLILEDYTGYLTFSPRAMIVAFLLRWLIPHYEVLVCNPQTGQPSGKSVFATLSFVAGIGLALFSAVVDWQAGRAVNPVYGLLLLGNGSLLAGLKVYQQQLNRRTADDSGQPLSVPPPAQVPPPVMPQVENPNAPSAPTE